MRLSDFDYELPAELIAQEPLPRREHSRLLVLDGDRTLHRRFSELGPLLRRGDVLVLNDSRVVPARVRARRATGGRAELLVLGEEGGLAEVLVRAKPLREGERLVLPEGSCTVERRKAGARYLVRFEVEGGVRDFLGRRGEMPTPPYIKRALEDSDRYQTVYSREPGSVAAPTAGLHFSPPLLEELRERGVVIAFITLHVGPATFQPMRGKDVEDHRMEPEYFRVPAGTAEAVNGRRGRLVAVGTTVVKALESALARSGTGEGGCGRLVPCEGSSDLFIYPGHRFRLRPDLLLTNFHLPMSTLILLVSALVGRERLLGAYREAVRERYRFLSFGDAMLCLPGE